MKVFIAEDHFAIRLGLEAVLAQLGHAVVATAGTSDEAYRWSSTVDADWALLDVDLGDGSSYGAARVLVDRGIRVVFLTGHDYPPDMPADLSDLPRLTKPVFPADLNRLLSAGAGARRR